MIPQLTELWEKLGPSAVLVPFVLGLTLTGLLFLAQSVVEWFRDRNP